MGLLGLAVLLFRSRSPLEARGDPYSSEFAGEPSLPRVEPFNDSPTFLQ